MAIELQCPLCMREFRFKDDVAGKKIRCSECRHLIEVPNKARPQQRRKAARQIDPFEDDDDDILPKLE